MKKTREKLYCGDSFTVKDEYTRRGSPHECMKKGYGSALYRNSDRTEFNEKYTYLGKRIISPEEDRKYGNLTMYQDFLNTYFESAKTSSRNLKLGDVFTQLAIMWRDKYKEEVEEEENEFEEKYDSSQTSNNSFTDISKEIEEIEELFSEKEELFRRLSFFGDIKKQRSLSSSEKKEVKEIIESIITIQFLKDTEQIELSDMDTTKTEEEKIHDREKLKQMSEHQYNQDVERVRQILK